MYQSSSRAPTLHQWDIPDASSLPLPQEKRKRTDVCCLIVWLLLLLGLLIAAIVVHNSSNLDRSQYPTDSTGTICLLDAKNGSQVYPFLYFDNLRDPLGKRYCVQECPQQGVPTNCYGKSCDPNFYPNYPSSNNLGALCLPQDPTLKAQLLDISGMGRRFNAVRAVDMLLIGIGVTFGLALIWMALVQFLPKVAVWVAFAVSAILLVVAAILCFMGAGSHFSENESLAIVVGIVFLIFFLMIVLYVCLHKKQVDLCGCFLNVATDCLKDNLTSLLYLLLFISLTILFIVLLVFEYLSFSSSTLTLNGLYYQNNCNGWLLALLVFQAIWGFSFFRDSFNYVMSGIADEWYFHKIDTLCYPLRRYFLKNIGSVIGGSLLTGFFYLPNLILSFLAPNADCTLCNLFDLARSDVYSYIYLTGNSYCPSSRQVQYLCRRSRICRQNQNATALYAFAARLATALIAVLIVYWISKDNLVYEEVPFTVLGGVFLACMYLGCYCSDIHAIIAQALVICFLTEYDMEEGWSYKEMRACPNKLTQLVTDLESQGERVLPWQ